MQHMKMLCSYGEMKKHGLCFGYENVEMMLVIMEVKKSDDGFFYVFDTKEFLGC